MVIFEQLQKMTEQQAIVRAMYQVEAALRQLECLERGERNGTKEWLEMARDTLRAKVEDQDGETEQGDSDSEPPAPEATIHSYDIKYNPRDLVRATQTLTSHGGDRIIREGTVGKVVRSRGSDGIVVQFGESLQTWICSPFDIEPIN